MICSEKSAVRGFNVKQWIWIFNVQISEHAYCITYFCWWDSHLVTVRPVYVSANSAQVLLWLSHCVCIDALHAQCSTLSHQLCHPDWTLVDCGSETVNCIPLRVGASINTWDINCSLHLCLFLTGLSPNCLSQIHFTEHWSLHYCSLTITIIKKKKKKEEFSLPSVVDFDKLPVHDLETKGMKMY